MTNGDVIKDLFNPRDDQIKVYGEFVEIEIQRQGINFTCELKWWNSPCQLKEKESATVAVTIDKDGKSDALDEVRAEMQKLRNCIDDVEEILDKHNGESKESSTVAKFHDFYVEDEETWPPVDQEVLIQSHFEDNFSNHIAYLEFDDGEDGGWGFYNKDGEFIADVTEIDAWMPIPQYERDKNYIPIQERRSKNLNIDDLGPEEEKD